MNSDALTLEAREELRVATAKTLLLFESWLRTGIPKLPVHSATGLPKPESIMGYAGLWDEFVGRGMLTDPATRDFWPYAFVAAWDRGLDLEAAEAAFVDGYRAPEGPAAALKNKTGARLVLAEMKKRGIAPPLPLGPDGLPAAAELSAAYAALYRFLTTPVEEAAA